MMAVDMTNLPEQNGAVATAPQPQVQANGNSTMALNEQQQPNGLSADEIAQYDRQLRLWGAQAQEKIRAADILLISLRALGTEIAKNLTLAGINSLTVVDDNLVTEDDLGAQYFLREADLGKPRAEAAIPRIAELNPRVKVTSGGSLSVLVAQPPDFYRPFSCIIACDFDYNTLNLFNTNANLAGRPFYAAGLHGFYGFIFADLGVHEYKINREKSNIPTQTKRESETRTVVDVTTKQESDGKTMEVVTKREQYCPLILANTSKLADSIRNNRRRLKAVPALLPCLRALFDFQAVQNRMLSHTPEDLTLFTKISTQKAAELQLPPETISSDFLRSFLQSLDTELVPVAAFVGGRLSEDVINVLGEREQPIQNFALFDGDALEGNIYCLYSPPPQLLMPGSTLVPETEGLGTDRPTTNGENMDISAPQAISAANFNGIGDLGLQGMAGANQLQIPMHGQINGMASTGAATADLVRNGMTAPLPADVQQPLMGDAAMIQQSQAEQSTLAGNNVEPIETEPSTQQPEPPAQSEDRPA